MISVPSRDFQPMSVHVVVTCVYAPGGFWNQRPCASMLPEGRMTSDLAAGQVSAQFSARAGKNCYSCFVGTGNIHETIYHQMRVFRDTDGVGTGNFHKTRQDYDDGQISSELRNIRTREILMPTHVIQIFPMRPRVRTSIVKSPASPGPSHSGPHTGQLDSSGQSERSKGGCSRYVSDEIFTFGMGK